jgi:COP9 signalosome complex subunit 6
VTANQV